MKTLHFYLARQVLATLFMTVAVFTFVLLLANTLKEILVLLINRQATLGGVAEAILYLIPWVLTFALPMGMLTAALLVFGRFSADQELTAVRASGVSLVALITPILVLSLLLCGVSALVNMEVGPRCRMAYKALLERMKGQLIGTALPEGRFVRVDAKASDTGTGYGSYLIYVERNDGHALKGIYIYGLDRNKTGQERFNAQIVAPRGEIQVASNQTTLVLYECHIAHSDGTNWGTSYSGRSDIELTGKSADETAQKPGIDNMTFRQLRAELRDTDALVGRPEFVSPLEVPRFLMVDKIKELRDQRHDFTTPIRVQLHTQVALSFACFGFTLVGIPLGIRAHRRETNIGLVIAIALAATYYSLVITGQSLSRHAELYPYLIVWLPNFLFQAVGAVLLWRVNRGL